MYHVIVYAQQHAQTWASVWHLFAFLFAHRIAFVSECMHIWLLPHAKSYLLEERGGRWVVWSAGTSKPLWLADWLPGSPVD